MTLTLNKLALSAAALAAVSFAPLSGTPKAVGVASAATLAAQAGLQADTSAVTLAKKGPAGPGNFKPGGNGPGPKPPIGPGDLKPGGKGGGGKGDKGGKGGHHHHHYGVYGIGGALILGAGYCAVQAERCATTYGDGTYRYWRCMRRTGCAD
ncbi:MAG TPA: hypothetical protein VG758_04315 [Hyphomicrobiaceae bacterium]|jgi:hypothetical protein|nr:hypothetical protein [Hyphomicrobiaceae bacterium]